MNKQKFIYLAMVSFIVVVGFVSCTNINKQQVKVDFTDSTKNMKMARKDTVSPIYVAIASITSPRETFIYYHDLIDFISKKLNRPVLIKEKKTYEEVNNMLARGEVSFAFICSGAYINAKAKKEVRLLVAPIIDHETYYQAYIITKKNSPVHSFSGLKNHSFAFTDPISNTGFMYPKSLLNKLSTNEASFFSKTIFTYGHDVSIQMVDKGVIDAASVHSLIYKYIERNYPERVQNVKVINESQKFGMPPVVTPENLDNKCFKRLQDIFLTIDKDSTGVKIIKKLGIERFVKIDDSIYNSVRNLKK